MHGWLRDFHGANAPFPPLELSIKIAITLAVGLLVGFEREWSHKDIGARTFAMAALLGLLGALLGTPALVFSGGAVLILCLLANVRGLQVARKLEATTSLALAIVFLLGILVGQGHLFTPVACSIVVTMLLSLKPQFRAFAGGLKNQEIRSAITLALLGFVIWPLLPNRFVDPWHLFQPREDWVIVVVIACLGFFNYVLLRLYGSKGIYLTAVLGGLVNSTASVAALVSTVADTDLIPVTIPVVLLTSLAMFLRNIVILAIFARSAARIAVLPLVAMSAVAAYWIYRDRKQASGVETAVPPTLTSPVSLRRVLNFALLFLAVQVLATLGQRLMGSSGFEIVSALGGLVSSASTTAAAANMAMHGKVSVGQAGLAAVLTSVASALVNLPIVYRTRKTRPVMRELLVSSVLQVVAGAAAFLAQWRFLRWF
jgi:uncharacterized membrane protein (DUF4010 family)